MRKRGQLLCQVLEDLRNGVRNHFAARDGHHITTQSFLPWASCIDREPRFVDQLFRFL
jgi:hypothetical protein